MSDDINEMCIGRYKLKCNNIYISIFCDHTNCLKKYIERGDDINEEKTEEDCGLTKYTLPTSFLCKIRPLTLAFTFHNLEGMKILLENGANPNYTASVSGQTLIHLACCSLRVEFVSLLLYYNADISIKNNYGEFPIDLVKNILHDLEKSIQEEENFYEMRSMENDIEKAETIISMLKNYSSTLDIKEPSVE